MKVMICKKYEFLFMTIIFLLISAGISYGASSANYILQSDVISGGGGGGGSANYSIEHTTGQSSALEDSSSSSYLNYPGFWNTVQAVVVPTADVSGDIKLGGSPIANRKVTLKQKGQVNQTTTTDSGGYYEFAHAVSGIKYTVQISGPAATSTNISGCADFRGAPIVNKTVKLKQSLELTKSTKTDASGCYVFTNAVLGKTFKVIITGPVVP